MGLFNNIKKILFEDDDEEDETTEIPTFTKEDVEETEVKMEPVEVKEEPIKTNDNSYFPNVKRDIDLNFDEKDILGEIPGAAEVISKEEPKVEEVVPPAVEEPKEKKNSVFLSFDEEEFERLNSKIVRNESRAKKINHDLPNADVRKANNNFSSTTTREVRSTNTDKYKIDNDAGAKVFTPSPIISPVYGILDKNYTKDEIVDKKGGIKRQIVPKPIVRKKEVKPSNEVELPKVDNSRPVDIDSVRRKAFGLLDDLPKEVSKPVVKEEKNTNSLNEVEVKPVEVKPVEVKKPEEDFITKTVNNDLHEAVDLNEKNLSVEDQLDEKFSVDDMVSNDSYDDEDIEIDKVLDNKPKMLDDLEKTSTLQILDDIERELNSIKPSTEEETPLEEDKPKGETLEKDLYNLIDSMYVEREEEDNG